MKYTFLLFLVLPNVLSFMIYGYRKQKPIRNFLKSSKPATNLELTDGRRCFNEELPHYYGTIYQKWNPLLGYKTVQKVDCNTSICDDGTGPVGYIYFCKPNTEYVCATTSRCPSPIKISTQCDCNYHHPDDLNLISI